MNFFSFALLINSKCTTLILTDSVFFLFWAAFPIIKCLHPVRIWTMLTIISCTDLFIYQRNKEAKWTDVTQPVSPDNSDWLFQGVWWESGNQAEITSWEHNKEQKMCIWCEHFSFNKFSNKTIYCPVKPLSEHNPWMCVMCEGWFVVSFPPKCHISHLVQDVGAVKWKALTCPKGAPQPMCVHQKSC